MTARREGGLCEERQSARDFVFEKDRRVTRDSFLPRVPVTHLAVTAQARIPGSLRRKRRSRCFLGSSAWVEMTMTVSRTRGRLALRYRRHRRENEILRTLLGVVPHSRA